MKEYEVNWSVPTDQAHVQLLRVLRHTLVRLGNSAAWCWVQGTLRVLLVLLHDFPELLCEYHFALCDCVPPSCIQVRSACDRFMSLMLTIKISSSDTGCVYCCL
jgi:CCR4-Not complex component, Not1